MLEDPGSVEGIEKTEVSFSCSASGKPAPKWEFFKVINLSNFQTNETCNQRLYVCVEKKQASFVESQECRVVYRVVSTICTIQDSVYKKQNLFSISFIPK